MLHDFHPGSALAALCGSNDPLALISILVSLLAAGFIGSFAHCATMCGPFVLMQVARGDMTGPTLRRSTVALLPFYHFGRLSTYTGLGALAGGLGGSLIALTELRWIIAIPLAAAAMMFLLQALKSAAPMIALPSLAIGSRMGAVVARAAGPLLRPPPLAFGGLRGVALGLVLGFLPCGFLYAALTAAAATGTMLGGAVAMAAFGIGTVPALVLVGALGNSITQRWRPLAAAALPVIFLVNALTLAAIALHVAA